MSDSIIPIRVIEKKKLSLKGVNARKLHQDLESRQAFSTWFSGYRRSLKLVEGEDYTIVKVTEVSGGLTTFNVVNPGEREEVKSPGGIQPPKEKNLGGRQPIDYMLSPEAAAKIVTSTRGAVGKQARLDIVDRVSYLEHNKKETEKRLSAIEQKLTLLLDAPEVAQFDDLKWLEKIAAQLAELPSRWYSCPEIAKLMWLTENQLMETIHAGCLVDLVDGELLANTMLEQTGNSIVRGGKLYFAATWIQAMWDSWFIQPLHDQARQARVDHRDLQTFLTRERNADA